MKRFLKPISVIMIIAVFVTMLSACGKAVTINIVDVSSTTPVEVKTGSTVEKILETVKKAVSLSLQKSYGIDIKTYLGYTNQSEEEFEESLIEEQVKPMMDSQMICYAVFDDAGLKLTQQDVDKKINEKIAEIGNGVTKEDLIEAYGDFYFEAVIVKEKVLDYLYDTLAIS